MENRNLFVTSHERIRNTYCPAFKFRPNMKKMIPLTIILTLALFSARAGSLQSGQLAVLRAGDGELDLKLRQAPIFIDEFATGKFNQSPLSSIAIPTNGPNALFFNGHAATEGILARSADHRLLTVAGYGGVNLLQSNGTPSLLNIGRAFCTVDAAGAIHTTIYQGLGENEKMNPRGVVTDGANNFWGCGNAFGTVYWSPSSAAPTVFDSAPNSRAIRIIGNTLYVTLNGADATAGDTPAGIFCFQDATGNPAPLPRLAGSELKLEVKAREPYTKIAGFDMNPEHTIAYTADTVAGIQKYVKSNGSWNFAYNFSIPQTIPTGDNHSAGCFAVVVNFSGAAPVIYATTTEGYGGSVNSNRVVQIVDTNATATVTTIAQAGSAKIAYRGIDFTPDSRAAKP
jgi:hypothetical protein